MFKDIIDQSKACSEIWTVAFLRPAEIWGCCKHMQVFFVPLTTLESPAHLFLFNLCKNMFLAFMSSQRKSCYLIANVQTSDASVSPATVCTFIQEALSFTCWGSINNHLSWWLLDPWPYFKKEQLECWCFSCFPAHSTKLGVGIWSIVNW